MAGGAQTRLPVGGDAGRVRDVDIAERMEQAFLDYSMSVIVGRALPDARDGLKPVQRRILYAMWEGGLRAGRPHRKCASAVGDVMRKYHPHGDASIYDALARMAQEFTCRAPLVDGNGNFGSVDGDAPAAMRYTEARLSEVGEALIGEIDEDTVDLAPNYDGYEHEPVVLPGRVPNLLVNGASGIAVGVATQIPPHALGEVIAACRLLLERPDAGDAELRAALPAPDFPTGGRVVADEGLDRLYREGRGAVTVEAVATTEVRSGGLPRIVVTEIPYQVNKASLLERIAELVRTGRVEGVRDLRDESSRDGLRVVVELKRGEQPGAVLARLQELTDLRARFHGNMVALVDGRPRTCTLRELLTVFCDHQREALTRRSRHRRDRAAARLHIVEGLLTALDDLDAVIELIRSSETVEEARGRLIERLDLSDEQATAILDMQLRRLAALERRRLEDERDELTALIAELERVLGDPAALDAMLSAELADLAERHADDRRSRVVEPGEQPADGEQPAAALEAQPVHVTLTRAGALRPVADRPRPRAHPRPRDPLVAALRARVDDAVLVVDAGGAALRVDLADAGVRTARERGPLLTDLLGAEEGAWQPAACVRLPGDDEAPAPDLVTVTAAGRVKRTGLDQLRTRTRTVTAMAVGEGDRVVAAVLAAEADQVVLASDAGLATRFDLDEVRPTGRGAGGVAGMRLDDRAEVVALSCLPDGEGPLAVVGADGVGKRLEVDEVPAARRGAKGVRVARGLGWAGAASFLHVPTDAGWRVVDVDRLAPAGRQARGKPAVEPPTGPVVAEPPAARA